LKKIKKRRENGTKVGIAEATAKAGVRAIV